MPSRGTRSCSVKPLWDVGSGCTRSPRARSRSSAAIWIWRAHQVGRGQLAHMDGARSRMPELLLGRTTLRGRTYLLSRVRLVRVDTCTRPSMDPPNATWTVGYRRRQFRTCWHGVRRRRLRRVADRRDQKEIDTWQLLIDRFTQTHLYRWSLASLKREYAVLSRQAEPVFELDLLQERVVPVERVTKAIADSVVKKSTESDPSV